MGRKASKQNEEQANHIGKDSRRKGDMRQILITGAFAILAGIGLYLFIKSGMYNYLFFRVPFAFLDYEKAGGLVLLENLLMLIFWAFLGAQIAFLLRSRQKSRQLVFILLSVLIGVVLHMAVSGGSSLPDGVAAWLDQNGVKRN